MRPSNRIPTHPGEVLLEEFLKPLGITQVRLAEHLGIPLQRVNEIIKGKRGVSPETAWFLAQTFKTSPEFWSNLQRDYDLATHQPPRQVLPWVTPAHGDRAQRFFKKRSKKPRRAS